MYCQGRVIREAILEAEIYAKNLGGEWHVLSNPEFSVVRPTYFFHEDGSKKDKPFKSIYNTADKLYMDSYKIKLVDTQLIIYHLNQDDHAT